MLPKIALYFATPANPGVTGGDSGAGTTPGQSGGGQGGGAGAGQGSGGQQGGQGGQGGAAAQTPQGLEQLRSAYDNIKKEFEPWQKLNLKPEQVTQQSAIYQKVYTEIATLGRHLGYKDDEIMEALETNPVAVLDYLRNELAQQQQGQGRQGQGDQSLEELVEARLNEALAPINERENTRMTNEANAVFERTTYQMAADLFKKEGIDISQVHQDELDMIMSGVSEFLKYDEDALRALKYEGKTAGIQKAFNEMVTMLDKYYIARSGRSNRVGGQQGGGQQGTQQGGQGGHKPTLDEMIDNPGLINQKYKE